MNQFIVENPVLVIVVSFIIGAIIMSFVSSLAVRLSVAKEMEMGKETLDECLNVWVGIDGDGSKWLYLAPPIGYKQGEGPLNDYGFDYFYHPSLQYDMSQLDKVYLASLGILLLPKEEVNMSLHRFTLEGIYAYNLLTLLSENQ